MDTINRIAKIRVLNVNRQEMVSEREESPLFSEELETETRLGEIQSQEIIFSMFSQQDIHSIVDIEKGTPKEIAHIVVANLAFKLAFMNLTASYDHLMEEFRTALAPTEPVNSWAALLPEGQRLKDQWTNDLEKSTSSSMRAAPSCTRHT